MKQIPTTICLTIFAATVAAQVRVPRGQAESKVPIAVALQVGSESYQSVAPGSCHHTAQASIYDVVAEQWSVEQAEGSRSFTLTLWHPKNGPGDMISLALTTGGKQHVVDTVKAGSKTQVRGSGTATLTPTGSGGTFTVNAVGTDGVKITGTIKCDNFTAPAAVAGD